VPAFFISGTPEGCTDLTPKSKWDRLALTGIRLFPRIGVTEEERSRPQHCSADVALWADFEAAASTDRLAAALDYRAIHAKVVEVAHSREYNLVETLAYRIARSVMEAFPVERVNVKVRKRPESLAESLEFVEVEVDQT
jgi:dihydroneopterin aldolase